jgi:hypothetical protein
MMRKYFVTFLEKNLTGNAGLVHLGSFAEKLGIGEMLRKKLSMENCLIIWKKRVLCT